MSCMQTPERGQTTHIQTNSVVCGAVKAHLVLVLLDPVLSNDCQCRAVLHSLDHIVNIVHEEQCRQCLVLVCLGLHAVVFWCALSMLFADSFSRAVMFAALVLSWYHGLQLCR